MVKITLITVGKIKEACLRDAAAEYVKRLSRYCKLQIIEVTDEKTPDNAGAEEENRIKEKEAEKIQKHLKEDAFVIALAIEGKQQDSVTFAHTLQKLGVYGTSHIQFIIGGSLGLHDTVTQRANMLLSFSKMTFPHQLMRVILLEQIYRGYRIISNEPYHK